MIDAKAFGLELAGIVKAQLDPITARLDALEKRLDDLPTPRDGKDADLDEVRQIIGEELAGIKCTIEAIQPAPELPDIPALIDAVVREAVAAIPAPQDGKSVTVDDVAPLIASEVEKRVSELPRAKDGIDGKDGVGLAGALIDRDGKLVVTLTNGETKNLGPVVGRDGIDAKGEDGKDGLGFDDLDATFDGEKTVTLKFSKGERVKEFAFAMPVVIDRGVFKEGQAYKAGDGVTWGGSFWIAQEDTEAKPDSGKGWRLAVKKGRDGRDGTTKGPRATGPIRLGPKKDDDK
jgi:hypothetical protein